MHTCLLIVGIPYLVFCRMSTHRGGGGRKGRHRPTLEELGKAPYIEVIPPIERMMRLWVLRSTLVGLVRRLVLSLEVMLFLSGAPILISMPKLLEP